MPNIIKGSENGLINLAPLKQKSTNSFENSDKSFNQILSETTNNILDTSKNVDTNVNDLAMGKISPETAITSVSIGASTLEAGMDIIKVGAQTANKILDMQV